MLQLPISKSHAVLLFISINLFELAYLSSNHINWIFNGIQWSALGYYVLNKYKCTPMAL